MVNVVRKGNIYLLSEQPEGWVKTCNSAIQLARAENQINSSKKILELITGKVNLKIEQLMRQERRGMQLERGHQGKIKG